MAGVTVDEDRATYLRDAEAKARMLFEEVVRRGLLVPGSTERQVSDQVRDLAHELIGTKRFWHKRVVRAGANTMLPYRANPPDLTIQEDDICFLDFRPILQEWEADFGRTYVLGDDPDKHALADRVPVLWEEAKAAFDADPDMTGSQLYALVGDLITAAGYDHQVPHAGHLIGHFPHEKVNPDDAGDYITTGNDQPLRRPDAQGQPCHWILEIHAVDTRRGYGAFFEQLLTA